MCFAQNQISSQMRTMQLPAPLRGMLLTNSCSGIESTMSEDCKEKTDELEDMVSESEGMFDGVRKGLMQYVCDSLEVDDE